MGPTFSHGFLVLLTLSVMAGVAPVANAQESNSSEVSTLEEIEPLPQSILEAETIDVDSKHAYEQPVSTENWFGGKQGHGQFSHRFDLVHDHPDDPARHIGFGQPLAGMSWRNRPIHADVFAGAIMLQNLIPGEVEQEGSFFDGVRLGYDFDHYWGAEVRLGLAEGRLTYPANASFSGKSQLILLDYNVQFYPWGDSAWRPYATLGLGAAVFQYEDAIGRDRGQAQVSMPFGLGLKYFIHKRLALRFELLDNMTLGGTDASSSSNFSVTGGFEYRFGGSAPGYFR
ncbi:outer membrane beta-barrel protein [Bremerella alba]|uniref:Outer membrane protein beta-barrel domain-containing protein n=1 Tax=Bremerella alba TaxID=980252 RepID=A0A7V9A9G3_9BACT|nr:outer membrane beta-barrel protein [Bremerella alba]MBA2117323.1 hypothetical protein [Bremerella alba]